MLRTALTCFALMLTLTACPTDIAPLDDAPPPPPPPGEGEGEGDAAPAEGEGEGDAAEGEGEGDGAAGEGGEGEGDAGAEGEGEGEGEGGPATVASCFAGIESQTGVTPDYDQYAPVVGAHCAGTNHQDISGIERVVFLGDSVTVGTPPTPSAEFYRARLADALAERFGLEAPSGIWKSANPITGEATLRQSGDFWSCAKWGARTDDLVQDNAQVADCFPAEERDKHTLVIMTMGGNDIAAFTKDGAEGMPLEEVTLQVQQAIDAMRAAVEYLKDTTVFPGGVEIVFTNNFEFTDGTGDVGSCPAAAAAGFAEPWEDPTALAELVVYMMEQYLVIAVETGSDMLFVLESFCGHGYHHDDPANACYRGPDSERWFDLTCIHPNPTGHGELADMFLAVVDE